MSKNKKISKKILTTLTLSSIVFGGITMVATSHSSNVEVSKLTAAPTTTPTPAPTPAPDPDIISFKEEISNNQYHQPIFSVDDPDNLTTRDKLPESLTNTTEWKEFLKKNAKKIFVTPAGDASWTLPIDNIEVTISGSSNEKDYVALNIQQTKPTARPVGELVIKGFKARPSLPEYIRSDSQYAVIDGSNVQLANIGKLLTNEGFIDGSIIRKGWYPFNYVNAFINNDSNLYHELIQLAIDQFTYAPGNDITKDTKVSISLPNYNISAVNEYKESGMYETLNNKVTGNELDNPQLVVNATFQNVVIGGKTVYSHEYSMKLFNSKIITTDCFNTNSTIKTNITTLATGGVSFGNTLDELNVSSLLTSLGYYVNKGRASDLPSSVVTLHKDTKVIKNYKDNTATLKVDITNIIHDESNKYIGNYQDITWIVEGFTTPPITVDPEINSTTVFNTASIHQMIAPASINGKLAADVTPGELTNIIGVEQISKMFTNLPNDFSSKKLDKYYVIDDLEPDSIRNEIKVYISLTYAKISNHNVYNVNGTAVKGYFIIKDFAAVRGFGDLNKEITASGKPQEVYQFDPRETLRLHLIDYVNGTVNCFSNVIKTALLEFLNNKLEFNDNVNIISKTTDVKGANKASPKLTIRVNSNRITEITNDPTFANVQGVEFVVSNFLPYLPTEVTIVTNSFLNYTYEQFVDEIEKDNIGINKPLDKNNLVSITNLPDNKTPPRIVVSKMHTTGMNAKAIVSIVFPQFYSDEGLKENYTYNVVVALQPTEEPEVDTSVFNREINVADLDTASGLNWKQMTAPLAVQYFSNSDKASEVRTTINRTNVAQVFFRNPVPASYDIEIASVSLKSKRPQAISLTLSNSRGLKETITIDGFKAIAGVTEVTSTLPAGTNFDTLKTTFAGLTGTELDTKAKTFINVLNPVDGYLVKGAEVVSVKTNDAGEKVARISFKLSEVYWENGVNAYKIVKDVIYQFEYTQSASSVMTGKLINTKIDDATTTSSIFQPWMIAIIVVGAVSVLGLTLALIKYKKSH